jgi:hypothetical protein
LLVDTNIADDAELATFEGGHKYGVTAHSMLVFGLTKNAT